MSCRLCRTCPDSLSTGHQTPLLRHTRHSKVGSASSLPCVLLEIWGRSCCSMLQAAPQRGAADQVVLLLLLLRARGAGSPWGCEWVSAQGAPAGQAVQTCCGWVVVVARLLWKLPAIAGPGTGSRRCGGAGGLRGDWVLQVLLLAAAAEASPFPLKQ